MRWNNLFDDLESQLDHELNADEVDVRAEEERLRIGRLSLRDRLHSLLDSNGGGEVVIRLEVGGVTWRVRPQSLGRDWLAGMIVEETFRNTQVIVPLRAITSLILDRTQLTASLAAPTRDARSSISARLGLSFVLRDLCRRRCSIDLELVGGQVHGTIDRVGRDHLDVAIHEAGSPRRETHVAHYRTVPFDQLLLLRL